MSGSTQKRARAIRISITVSLCMAAHACSDGAEPAAPSASGSGGASATSRSSAEAANQAGQTAAGSAGPRAASAGRASPAADGGRSGASGSADHAMSAGSAAAAGRAGRSAAGGAAEMTAGASGQAASAQAGSGGATEPADAGGQDAGAQAGSGGATEPPDAGMAGMARPAQWRIVALGDSITETTCASQLLDHGLRAAGHTQFDLVGTRKNEQACGTNDADRDCEGHSGYLVTDLIGQGQHASELATWCQTDRADVVLMHFGTNDVWNAIDPTRILDAFSGVLTALRAAAPNVIVLVAQIIPMRPDNCSECAGRVEALNARLPDWAAMQTTATSPVHVVDQWTGFDPASDTGDGVHPNLQGSQKMADRWIAALEAHGVF